MRCSLVANGLGMFSAWFGIRNLKIQIQMKKEQNSNNAKTQALNIPVVNGSFMTKESKCKYTNTLNDIHSKIVTYKDYWLFTEVFCLLHDNNDFCNCR